MFSNRYICINTNVKNSMRKLKNYEDRMTYIESPKIVLEEGLDFSRTKLLETLTEVFKFKYKKNSEGRYVITDQTFKMADVLSYIRAGRIPSKYGGQFLALRRHVSSGIDIVHIDMPIRFINH